MAKKHKSNWARCLAKWQHIVFGEICAGKVFHCPPETLDIICFWLIIAAVVGHWNHPLLAISSKQRQDKPGLKKDQCLFARKGPNALHHLQPVGVDFQTNTAVFQAQNKERFSYNRCGEVCVSDLDISS